MDELTTIELLHEVLLGEKTQQLPSNSVQRCKTAQSAAAQELIQAPQPERVTHTPASVPAITPTHENDAASSLPNNDAPNYISDDESVAPDDHRNRRSKRISRQQRSKEDQQLHRIINLVENESATIPDLKLIVSFTY